MIGFVDVLEYRLDLLRNRVGAALRRVQAVFSEPEIRKHVDRQEQDRRYRDGKRGKARSNRDGKTSRRLPNRTFGIDRHDGRKQPERDQRQKENQIAQLDHATAQRIEAREETHRGNGVHQNRRRPAAKYIEHHIDAAQGEQETHDRTRDEGNDLIAGQRRHAGADRQERARHQKCAGVADQDNAVVGVPEGVHRKPAAASS